MTGGLILVAAIGGVVYQQVSKPEPPAEITANDQPITSEPQPAPPKPSTEPPPQAPVTDPPPAATVPDAPAAEREVVRDSRVKDAERRATQQLAAGNQRSALRYIDSGLRVTPNDAPLLKLRRDVMAAAQQDAEEARRAVRAAGASGATFRTADEHLQSGHRERRAGRDREAIDEYWEATTGFRSAAVRRRALSTV